ncbi:MAG TPA: hypothetical protein VFV09_10350 [Actinomycetota bacterium]|nr:hypothetical protein [Actinomycetota bacterium]
MNGSINLTPANLGERVSMLFKIEGDPEHPFSEVVGVLMRVTGAGGPDATYSVIRRSGEVVEVRQDKVMALKLMPSGAGPLRKPASWDTAEGV